MERARQVVGGAMVRFMSAGAGTSPGSVSECRRVGRPIRTLSCYAPCPGGSEAS